MNTIKKSGILLLMLYFLHSTAHATDALKIEGFINDTFHTITFTMSPENHIAVVLHAESDIQSSETATSIMFPSENDDGMSMHIKADNLYALRFIDNTLQIATENSALLYTFLDFFSKTTLVIEVIDATPTTDENNAVLISDDTTTQTHPHDDGSTRPSGPSQITRSYEFLDVVTTQTNPHDDGSTRPSGPSQITRSYEFLDVVTTRTNPHDDGSTGPSGPSQITRTDEFLDVVTTQTNPHDDGSTIPTGPVKIARTDEFLGVVTTRTHPHDDGSTGPSGPRQLP
ncbi:MAG: hypothetical protein AAGB12_08145 [Pseudomonadota bacterium]